MIDSNKINHEVNYIKLLAVALSSDPVVMDKRLKDMCESQIIEMFQKPDMYADLFVLHKFILRNHEIDENVKRELIESIWRTDEEYNEMLNQLEWQVIGTIPPSESFNVPNDKVSMYDYSLEDLERMYQDPMSARIVHDEIELCRELIKIKPKSEPIVLKKKVN